MALEIVPFNAYDPADDYEKTLFEQSYTLYKDAFYDIPLEDYEDEAPLHGSGFVGLLGRNAVCMALVNLETSYKPEDNPQAAELTHLATLSSERGRGYGSLLIKQVELYVADNRKTHLDLYADNPAARRFYRRHGYTDRRPDLEAGWMQKILR